MLHILSLFSPVFYASDEKLLDVLKKVAVDLIHVQLKTLIKQGLVIVFICTEQYVQMRVELQKNQVNKNPAKHTTLKLESIVSLHILLCENTLLKLAFKSCKLNATIFIMLH